MLYDCKHFKLVELVHPQIFKAWGQRCWEFLDPRLLLTLDQLRVRYGSIYLNNWDAGGALESCGLRPFSSAVGAAMSQHKFGRAGDTHYNGKTPQEVYDDILANAHLFPELRRVEDIVSTPAWIHVDVAQHAQAQQVWIVKPA